MAQAMSGGAVTLQRALYRLGVNPISTEHVWRLPKHARAAALRPPCHRWTPSRKVVILVGLLHGELDQADVLAEFELTTEELTSWAKHLDAYGLAGLRTTKLQLLRNPMSTAHSA